MPSLRKKLTPIQPLGQSLRQINAASNRPRSPSTRGPRTPTTSKAKIASSRKK